ncbi:enoyl-CoA hydratase/isomerase family protein [Haliea sp. E17]|uniref:enoyl-CoA hydratase/isomerase family protein n=1 Tax=Haliea sp. E17 TaxID=3401576 RepID=UPI003AAD5298
MPDTDSLILPLAEVPATADWLLQQPMPVIAVGAGAVANADVVVDSARAAQALAANIARQPAAALALVQVLRAVERLPLELALNVESLAYATLQGGAGHRAWLQARQAPPAPVAGGDGAAVQLSREGDVIYARLNRPRERNSMTVEMRDALVELLELVILDTSITRVELSAAGACFSVGGELREFGLATDTAEAHRIRSLCLPGRLLARCADRVHCFVHSACLGSGAEFPAFAGRVTAHPKSFFQLPELELGLIPGAGGCVSISRRIGRQRTAWMVLSGKRVTAATALGWGLVDAVAESVDLPV